MQKVSETGDDLMFGPLPCLRGQITQGHQSPAGTEGIKTRFNDKELIPVNKAN